VTSYHCTPSFEPHFGPRKLDAEVETVLGKECIRPTAFASISSINNLRSNSLIRLLIIILLPTTSTHHHQHAVHHRFPRFCCRCNGFCSPADDSHRYGPRFRPHHHSLGFCDSEQRRASRKLRAFRGLKVPKRKLRRREQLRNLLYQRGQGAPPLGEQHLL
jgi:hypothetical protein